jgi:hypothetical protein
MNRPDRRPKLAPSQTNPKAVKKGNTVASFREENIPSVRIPARIRAGFAAMKEKGHAWVTNKDFSALSGVNIADLNTYAEEFPDQTHEAGNKSRSKLYWFVTPAAKAAALAE